jgi:hypothetical protein
LLVLALGVCVGGDCGGAALPAGLSATDIGCATKVAPDGFGFELIVPCGFEPNNDFTPLGWELYVGAFLKDPINGPGIVVMVGPPNIQGTGFDEEFDNPTYEGMFTSNFGVEFETMENVIEAQSMRLFLGRTTLPTGDLLFVGVNGSISDAPINKPMAHSLYGSVKFTQ